MSKTAEEFLIDWRKDNNTHNAVYSSYHIDAMEAYAAQQQPSELSDVEILLKSSEKGVYVNDQQRIGYQKGAKWVREEMRKRNQDV